MVDTTKDFAKEVVKVRSQKRINLGFLSFTRTEYLDFIVWTAMLTIRPVGLQFSFHWYF